MTTTQTSSGNRPTHKLYRVVKGRTKLDKDIWTEVAGCWPHKDGSGFNVKFKFNVPAPVHPDRSFRLIPIAVSDRSRSPVPGDPDQRHEPVD
jgi:hypothetical protein